MTEQGGEALYQVAVRALCEFSAKRGDLDLRFTPSPSALEGIAGHTLVTSGAPLTTSAKWRWTDATVTCRCAAGRMGTIRRRTAWRKSRPTAATSPCNRPTTGTCTGPRPGSTAGCSAPNGSWRKSNWRWSTWRSAARRRPASSSGCGPTSCGCSSRASARRFSPGPSRNWRTASGATANWPRYAFPTPNSATASGNWRRRCTRPPPPVVA